MISSSRTHASMDTVTRRDFLRTSAAVAGSTAAAVALQRTVHAQGSDTLKVGLIGCGGRGTGAAAQFLGANKGNQLVAMADIFPERLDGSLKNLQTQRKEQVRVDDDHRFVGLDAWRHVIDSDADVILIACASKFHPMYTLAALEAGKHVFCEKPHAIDASGVAVLRQATQLADEKKLCYASGLMSRYSPMLQELAKRIQDGMIGDILAARGNFLRAPYVVRTKQESDSETRYQFRNWYHFKWLSGDDVPQSLVHNMDRIAMFLGEVQPVRARGFGGRSASFGYQYGDQFDHNVVFYEYDNGMQTYAACTQQAGCSGGVQEFLFGSKGRMEHYRLVDLDGKELWSYQGKRTNWHSEVQVALSKAIREGEHINNGNYAAESTLTCILGQVACYTGRRYKRDYITHTNFRYGPEPKACSFEMEAPSKLGPDGQYLVPVPGKTSIENLV